MGNITIWVDFSNLDRFCNNLGFIGWSYQSSYFNIQISIPKQRIKKYEDNGEAGVFFECY